MHRVVPQLILDNHRSRSYRGEFSAVGLFLDLSGFSTMTDVLMQHGQHGAEVLAGLMHSVFDPLVESIFEFGGKIIGFAGDGVMALFPIETDIKVTATGALTSAWQIQQRLAANPDRQTVYGKFQFSVKIGLSIGRASWGILRSADDSKATYYFRGSAVDEASHAEHQAEAGEILLTGALTDLLKDSILTHSVGSFHRLEKFLTELPPATPTIFPPVDLKTASIFMPEAIIVQDIRGEFRQVVNLFMRFPDLPDEKLEGFVREIFELHKKYGGLVNRLDFGDKGSNMLMLWGAPVAHENDIGRALNFLLELRSRVDFPITAGVTYYIAHAGYLGGSMSEDYTCYGWGVNLAARFMMSAPIGQTWVDERIARRVSSRFEIDYIGSQRFKGFAAEQKVHLLKSRRRATEVKFQGKFIGREEEMARLEKFVEPLWENRFAGVLLIQGEAGIGKGRLVYEFRHSQAFQSRQARWAVLRADQILRHSFNPFRSGLFHYFDQYTAVDEEERKQRFDQILNELIASTSNPELAHELERLRSVLGALVDLNWEESLYERLDPEGRFNNTLLALIALIKAESLRQPLVLFIDDLQFIDANSSSFLPRLKRALLGGAETYPVALILNARSEGFDLSSFDELVDDRLTLHRLPKPNGSQFVDALLGGESSPNLVNLILERSAGNPFFIEQLVRFLKEENMLEQTSQGWMQSRRMRDVFLPGDVLALLVARLDRLSHVVRDMIQTASVLGTEFDGNVLLQLVGDSGQVNENIIEAERYGILARRSGDRLVFVHGLLRDAAYSMQMRKRRQELHGMAIRAVETVHAEHLSPHYSELAHHAELAEEGPTARHYYTLAAEVASNEYHNLDAIEYLTRALIFTPMDDLSGQYELFLKRVILYARIGERKQESQDLDELERLARELNDDRRYARARILHAQYCFTTGDYPGAVEIAREVVALSENLGDDNSVLEVYVVWAQSLFRLGIAEEALEISIKGLELARKHGRRVEEGRALTSLGLIVLEMHDPVQATDYLEEAVSIGRETGDRTLESRALANLANSAGYILRDYSAARKYYEEAYRLNQELGDRYAGVIALGNIGWVCGMLGDFPAARNYLEQALVVSREVGHTHNETYILMNLSAAAEAQQNSDEAISLALQATALCQKKSDKASEAWSQLYLGYAYLLSGQLSEAEAAFERSLEIRQEQNQLSLAKEPSAGLIQVALKKGDVPLAVHRAEEILRYFSEGGTLAGSEEPLRVYLACYRALATIQDPRAASMLRSAKDLLDNQVAKLPDEISRRRFIDEVPWRREVERLWVGQNDAN